MGRTTPAIRMNLEDLQSRMRSEYKDALLSMGRRKAFDRLVEAWSAEMGAISYAESISLMDLLLLTGAVDNRRVNVRAPDTKLINYNNVVSQQGSQNNVKNITYESSDNLGNSKEADTTRDRVDRQRRSHTSRAIKK